MPRKCVLCGASQSINLYVFAFPKSSHQRGAWVAAIQQIIPSFCDPQAEGQLTGVRKGVCERHFHPHDIRKGKNSSLHRKAVPLVAANLIAEGNDADAKKSLAVPLSVTENGKTKDSFLISEEDAFTGTAVNQMSVVCKKESTWQVDEDQAKGSENCIGINIDDFLPSENTFTGSVESIRNQAFVFSNSECSENDVCLVCGKEDKSTNLVCILRVHEVSGNVSASLLLSKIVGRSKREVLCVSMKICSRCENLIQEVAQIEEDLKYKKQAIKSMFEATLQEHKEKSKIVTTVSKPSDVHSDEVNCSRNSVSDSCFPVSIEDKSGSFQGDKISEKVRKSSRRQASARKYRCPQCKEVYASLALWVHHLSKHSDVEDVPVQNKAKQVTNKIKRKHKIGIHACEECGKTFFCKQTLLAHASAHQKGSECSVCGRYLTTKARLKAHLFKFHGIGEEKNKEVACQDCGRCFGTKAGLRYHRNVVHHIGTEYVCEHCNKMFYYHVPYRSHLLYAHGEKKIVCETCGEKFFTISKLNTHINAVHRSAKSWACDKCESKFTTYTAYRHHMNVKHLKIQHPCDYCSAQFRKKSSLMLHLWKHSVYICQMCRESFSCNDDLGNHMSVTHGKEINWKGKRKQNTQLQQEKKLVREEDVLQKNPGSDEHIQQSEHVASIVINDLLMTAESYDNSSLQPFSLSGCEKLPQKHSYTNDDMKVKTLSIIDASQDLRAVDSVQFDTDETLEVKSSHDPIEMTPGVSLINVQILGDMEISQSDTLGDLKNSMLADAADHLSHDGQLDSEDNMTGHLSVETHLSGEHLTVDGDLESASHTLESTDHLETACHLEAADHLESCHLDSDHLSTRSHLSAESHLEVPSQLASPHHLESTNHLKVAGHINTASHLDASSHLKDAGHLDPDTNVAVTNHLENSNHLESSGHMEPPEHLQMPTHIDDPTHLDSSSHLETADQCSLPSMISQMESEVDEQMVDPVNNPMVTQMDTEIHNMANEVDAQIVESANTHMSQDMDQLMVKETDAEMVEQSLDKQMEKMNEVELEPFPVTLDGKGEVQYQYVMYISASGEDNTPG